MSPTQRTQSFIKSVDAAEVLAPANSLQSQLKALQQDRVLQQKQQLEEKQQNLLTKQLQYPEGRLISRGVIILTAGDPVTYPYGFTSAADVDPQFASDTSTLFILGVGREGPPLAAKSYPLKDIQFPFVFELLSNEDLLFPYTEDAWLKSDNAKDSIATTAILSSSNQLSAPANTERYGFGLSEPITFAGVLTRSSTNIGVTGKIDSSLYTQEETDLLAGIDRALDMKKSTISSAAGAKLSSAK
eukprot:CAMPEP_0201097948 /NCGR_PEP_ID=MMETSP0812-20130820/7005_1 /ASSEMBLY_ACC=CAM_ASM_000668 /TAXON_ID=98059 /ORGANISM="Dinobryon sp., Strain UTEXLB2267" /LENGTH=243 /DNA_ID=CAMNT_0047353113 /DNA_START=129 /DNA_END=860 /DNA_ORIENTATION=-